MLFQQAISAIPFKHWLYKDKENKKMYLLAILTLTASFTWLKVIYPFPNFIPPDSYNYLESAYRNDFINIWPIGYSKFLQLIGLFSHSHLVLVIIQYVVLQASLLYLLFSIRYVFSPNKWLFRTLLTVSMLNPLLPHIANFVSSDCLFTALSIIWFTQLIWITLRPTPKLLILHSTILLFAFTVRYNALYYPFISVLIIIFSRTTKNVKWIGIISIAVLLLAFIGSTQYEYNKKTDTIQYAAFGGWQIAANALYGYAFSKRDHVEDIPDRFRPLHELVNQHIDSLAKLNMRPDREIGIYYLWDFKSPLRVYMNQQWSNDTSTSFFKKWARMAPYYAAYGRYLTLRHPKEFTTYYIWPNLKRYYSPPSYFMGVYNLGFSTVDPIAVKWFNLKSNMLYTRNESKQIPLADTFSIITPIINLVFVTSFLSFVFLGGFSHCLKNYRQVILCAIIIWIGNTVFSIFSAPIELRYQLFPLTISLIWASLFVAYILQVTWNSSKSNKSNESITPVFVEVPRFEQ
ncbi:MULTISPECIES: hypothetical protein [Niastella]|uniref:Glycosyltransferase RgtA/B/C/D-like domain-containing protein n=1 Tax=Niastella soli TaxID=2821487 RepID=A0ABS3Z374_9BACT|nr:hypothetical protein [Niastella soli]MBO9204614.1 hypothetical protein [Niastella soli]